MRRLFTSISITIALIYFMTKTTSPKIILIPFLICSISVAGQCIAEMLKQDRVANIFRSIYKKGFFLFWFGFLAVGIYRCLQDRSYGMLAYLMIFVVAGILMMRRKNQDGSAKFNFGIIIAASLVVIALLAGVFLLVIGFMRQEGGLIFGGAFFLMGGVAFVLGALTLKGCFDNFKIDVLGLYFGIVFVIIGIGFFVMGCHSQNNIPKAVLVIPLLMAGVGVLQVVKCLKNRN